MRPSEGLATRRDQVIGIAAARGSTDCGILMPSAFAVRRLMTS